MKKESTKMLIWELKRKLKDRICSNVLLENIPFPVFVPIYLFALGTMIILASSVTMFWNVEIDKEEIRIGLLSAIIILSVILTWRELKIRVLNIIEEQEFEVYLIFSELTRKQILKNIIKAEVIWSLQENVILFIAIFNILGITKVSSIVNFFCGISMVIICSVVMCQKLYHEIISHENNSVKTYNSNSKKAFRITSKRFKIILKCLEVIAAIIAGNVISKHVILIPLKFNAKNSNIFWKWFYSFDVKSSIRNSVANIVNNPAYFFGISIRFVVVAVIYAVVMKIKTILNERNSQNIKMNIYGQEEKNFIEKIGFFQCAIIGFFVGILVVSGVTYNKATLMLAFVMISNSLFFICSDILDMNNQYSFDYERERILLWINDFSKLFEVKRKIYYKREILPVTAIYGAAYFTCIKKVTDVGIIIYLLVAVAFLMELAFVEKNYLIVDNPVSISVQYDAMKNTYNRRTNEVSKDFKVFIASVLLVLGTILFACGEIDKICMIIYQIIIIIIIKIYILIRIRQIKKIIRIERFLNTFFE